MDKKQVLGLIGSIILFVGVFAPIVSFPIIGTMNYFKNGRGDGTIIIGLALISFILTLTKQYKGLWFTGLGSLGIMAFTFINFQMRISQVRSGMQKELADNPFKGLGELALQSVQLQWGWAFLVVGASLIIAAAALKEEADLYSPGKVMPSKGKHSKTDSDYVICQECGMENWKGYRECQRCGIIL